MKRHLFLLFILFYAVPSFATHLLGIDITYSHMGGPLYEIRVNYYRYCGGTAFDTNAVAQNAAGMPGGLIMQYLLSNNTSMISGITQDTVYEYPLFCPDSDSLSSCQSGWQNGLMGIEVGEFFGYIYLTNVQTDSIIFHSYGCCKPIGSNYPSNQGGLTSAFMHPINQNNSPIPDGFDIPILFESTDPTAFSLAMHDPDGDSLVYYLDTAYSTWDQGQYIQALFNSGYSSLNPFPGMTIDSLTGMVELVPIIPSGNNFGNYQIAVSVEQWSQDGDTLIGITHRNINIVIVPDSLGDAPSVATSAHNLEECFKLDSLVFEACSGDTFKFDYEFDDVNISDSLFASFEYDNERIWIDYGVSGSNPIVVHVEGFILTDETENLTFTIKVRDNQCPIIGHYEIPILIEPCQNLGTVYLCRGEQYMVNSATDSVVVWSVLAGPLLNSNNFNCLTSNCSSVELQPDSTTTYLKQRFMTNGVVWNDTFTIDVTQLPTAQISGDSVFCVGDTFVLNGAGMISGFTPSWIDTLSVTLSSSGNSIVCNSQNPNEGSIIYMLTNSVGCAASDTQSIVIQSNPVWQGFPNLNGAICMGDSLNLTPPPGFNYAFTPSTYLDTSGQSIYAILLDSINYMVAYSDSTGCILDTSISFEPMVNVLVGNASDNQGNPIYDGMAYLIRYDSLTDSVWAADSVGLGLNGQFVFYPLSSTHFVKVVPDSIAFPINIPTYYDSVGYIQNATSIYTDYCDTVSIDFNVLSGVNPGGPGFIAGIVSQGAGRGVGDPVKGLNIILYDPEQQPKRHTKTNKDGYFKFEGLQVGDYGVFVDKWGVDNQLAPWLSITEDLSHDSLQFTLYSDHLKLEFPQSVETLGSSEITVYPNPFTNSLTIRSVQAIDWVIIYSIHGQRIVSEKALANTRTMELAYLPSGAFFLEVTTENGDIIRQSVIKQ